MIFRIYAGLKGELGGAQYQYTGEFEDKEEALATAEQIATDAFFAHMGSNGYKSWNDYDRDALFILPAGSSKDEIDQLSAELAEDALNNIIEFNVFEWDSLDDFGDEQSNDD